MNGSPASSVCSTGSPLSSSNSSLDFGQWPPLTEAMDFCHLSSPDGVAFFPPRAAAASITSPQLAAVAQPASTAACAAAFDASGLHDAHGRSSGE